MRRYHYFAVFKPYGMLSQFTPDHPGQRTLADLGFPFPKSVYPVGRLDADSEGLLLLTDNAKMKTRLLAPEYGHERTYFAQVEGIPDEVAMEQLRQGVAIRIHGRMYQTLPALVHQLDKPPDLPPREPPVRYRKSIPDCWLQITLTEGKNRQVRRMCAAVGYPVLRLVRVQFGRLRLGQGSLRHLQKPGDVCVLEVGDLPKGWGS